MGRVHALFECPVGLRTIVYATNAVESLNGRFRKAILHHLRPPPESVVRQADAVATTIPRRIPSATRRWSLRQDLNLRQADDRLTT